MAVRNLSTVDIDARGNWWGDATGPYNATTNPGGKGNQVSDHVIFWDQPSGISITPDHAGAGSPSLEVTVRGSGFAWTSAVVWNGTTDLLTTFVSPTELKAVVGAPLITKSGAFAIHVRTPAGGTSGTVPFNVVDRPTSLYVINRTCIAGDVVTLKGYLKRLSDGAMLQGRTLTFMIGSREVGSAVTDATGQAMLNWMSDVASGAYAITVAFRGDTDYSPCTGAATFTATSVATKIYVPDRTGKIRTSTYLKAYLYRSSDNAPQNGRTLAFRVRRHAGARSTNRAPPSAKEKGSASPWRRSRIQASRAAMSPRRGPAAALIGARQARASNSRPRLVVMGVLPTD
jgi:hypothetical protein